MVLKKGARCFTHLLIKSESKVLNAREGAMPQKVGKRIFKKQPKKAIAYAKKTGKKIKKLRY